MTVSDGDPTPNPGEGAPENPAPKVEEPKTPEVRTFTQEQVDRIAATRAKDGEKAARQAIADQLGMSLDEAAQVIKQAREKQEAEKNELDKLRDANETLKRDSDTKLSEAQREHHSDRVKLRLLKAGVSLPEDPTQADEKLDRLTALIRVPVGGSVEEIDADIVDNLKVQFPEFFKAPEPKRETGNPPSNPSGTPRKPSVGAKSPEELGKEIAARLNAKRGVTAPTA